MVANIVFLVIGIVVGAGLGWFFARAKSQGASSSAAGFTREEMEALRSEKESIAIQKAELEGRLEKSLEVFNEQKQLLVQKEEDLRVASGKVQSLEAERKSIMEKLSDQAGEIEKLNERYQKEFKLLADEILKQNTKEFSQANAKQIDELLRPFKERIEAFEKRVNEVHSDDTKSRSQLLGQVKSLMELNKKISEDATNLTNALKGDSQKQGAWGEFILESILEHSGLEKGIEYETQHHTKTEEGVFKPDVIVNLPDDKYIVIDSKVSLVAYEAMVNAASEEERMRQLSLHVASLKNHIKGLSAKNYQLKTKGSSLDFVLMFVPIEPGFSEALKHDPSLYNFAWDNRIVIVSPTTLLATLRTIASVWKQEKQNRNVIAIAEESGKLYDKFVAFLSDMEKLKRGIDQSLSSYDLAMNKLQTGNGNLIRRAEKIKALGAKTSKDIPANLLEGSADE